MNENKMIRTRQIEKLFKESSFEQDFDFPVELLQINEENVSAMYNHSKKIMCIMTQYKELLMMYNCALKEIQTRFEILNAEFSVRHRRNPINSINSRLKRSTSIISKMRRNDIPLTIENMEENIHDIAGTRIICPYVDDIYQISRALINQEDIELIKKKDYIANPKPNGYQSMHLLIRVPVFFENQRKHVKVEVQIRTIAMDFWATLEHELRYKTQIIHGEEIAADLFDCAKTLAEVDEKMMDIRNRIEENRIEQSPEDSLFEQLSRIDQAII